jgi:hypothetical protein
MLSGLGAFQPNEEQLVGCVVGDGEGLVGERRLLLAPTHAVARHDTAMTAIRATHCIRLPLHRIGPGLSQTSTIARRDPIRSPAIVPLRTNFLLASIASSSRVLDAALGIARHFGADGPVGSPAHPVVLARVGIVSVFHAQLPVLGRFHLVILATAIATGAPIALAARGPKLRGATDGECDGDRQRTVALPTRLWCLGGTRDQDSDTATRTFCHAARRRTIIISPHRRTPVVPAVFSAGHRRDSGSARRCVPRGGRHQPDSSRRSSGNGRRRG